MPWRFHQGIDDAACGLVCTGLHGCSDAVRIGGPEPFSQREVPFQYWLSCQFCERQSVLQRRARCERLARLYISVAIFQCRVDDPSRIDLESGIQLLRLRRGRTFRLAGLQHFNVANLDCCSLYVFTRTDGPDRITSRPERAAEFPCEQRSAWSALRVLTEAEN